MKITKLFILAVAVLIVSSGFAASVTVINKTNPRKHLLVTLEYKSVLTKKIFKTTTENIGKKFTFTSEGANPFIRITWVDGVVVYSVLLESSGTMLNGEIVIWDRGVFALNFDKYGASSSKLKSYVTPPVKYNN